MIKTQLLLQLLALNSYSTTKSLLLTLCPEVVNNLMFLLHMDYLVLFERSCYCEFDKTTT